MTTEKKMQNIIIIGTVVVGAILYMASPQAPERTFAQVSAQTEPAAKPTPTKWLDGFCADESQHHVGSPAEMYESYARSGDHPKLIDNGDTVRIDAPEATSPDLFRTFYRTRAACEADKAARAAARERHERSLDKYH
jgi:hypothetical protein